MINAWSLAYDVLNGTLDENFPIKKKTMTDEIKLTGADEGVVNVPKGLEYHDPTHYVDEQGDIHLATSKDDFKVETTSDKKVFNVPSDVNLDAYEHSDAWYDYTRNDPDRENPFTDPKDRARAERVVGKQVKDEVVEELNINIPPEFKVDFQQPGIEDQTIRKYKEDESIKALQDYISTTYGGHYTSDNNNVQTLDLIESVGDAEAFCRSNAIKYLSRYDKKGQAKRDILKALHYSLLLYHFSGQLNETPTRGYETF